MTTMTNAECTSTPNLYNSTTNEITENMICAADTGKGFCIGDAGGAMITNEGKHYSVIGR